MPTSFESSVHLAKLVPHLLQETKDAKSQASRHIVVIQGEHVLTRHDTDRELPFHQEANFHYLTGCLVPSSTLIVEITGSSKPKRKLFIPQEDAESSMWSVPPPTLEVAAKDCGFSMSEIGYTEQEDESFFSELLSSGAKGSDEKDSTVIHLFSLNPADLSYPKLPTWLAKHLEDPSLRGQFTADHLQKALHRARLIKTEQEIGFIREACKITSIAHEVVMRELGKFARKRDVSQAQGQTQSDAKKKRSGKEGLGEWEIESEADAEAVFVASCRRFGAGQAYLPIVASGARASTLHYVCNDRLFPSTSNIPPPTNFSSTTTSALTHDSSAPLPASQTRGCCSTDSTNEPFNDLHTSPFLPQVLLIDAGCEFRGGYASDVTRTIPVGNGGKFTDIGKRIYSIVLKMQKEAEAICKAGAHWDDLHLLCHRILIEEFLEIGIFKDATVDEILKEGLSVAFFPHGLGHSLGLDVHDSLQLLRTEYLDLPASSKEYPHLFKYLRIRRTLEKDMVLTIEPGCYFSLSLMNEYKVRESKHVDSGTLYRYIPVGGVRIEDVVVVREEGCENLTEVGREVDWIEKACGGGA